MKRKTRDATPQEHQAFREIWSLVKKAMDKADKAGLYLDVKFYSKGDEKIMEKRRKINPTPTKRSE